MHETAPQIATIAIGVILTERGPRVSVEIAGETTLLPAQAASAIGVSLLRAATTAHCAMQAGIALAGVEADEDTFLAVLDNITNLGEDYEDVDTTIESIVPVEHSTAATATVYL